MKGSNSISGKREHSRGCLASSEFVSAITAIWCRVFRWQVNSTTTPTLRHLFDTFPIKADNSGVVRGVIRIKVLYSTNAPREQSAKIDKSGAPYPVVIFCTGGAVESNRYQWLGERLVKEAGVVYVLCEAVYESEAGKIITGESKQGKDPEHRGELVLAVIRRLNDINRSDLFENKLDLTRIVLGGHSAGGVEALMNADKDVYAGIVGSFIYASHLTDRTKKDKTGRYTSPMMGKEPLLFTCSTHDGVRDAVDAIFGIQWSRPAEPTWITYEQAVADKRVAYCVEYKGFNHFSIVNPIDATLRAHYVDTTQTVKDSIAQNELARIFILFVKAYAFQDTLAVEKLRAYVKNRTSSLIAKAECTP